MRNALPTKKSPEANTPNSYMRCFATAHNFHWALPLTVSIPSSSYVHMRPYSLDPDTKRFRSQCVIMFLPLPKDSPRFLSFVFCFCSVFHCLR